MAVRTEAYDCAGEPDTLVRIREELEAMAKGIIGREMDKMKLIYAQYDANYLAELRKEVRREREAQEFIDTYRDYFNKRAKEKAEEKAKVVLKWQGPAWTFDGLNQRVRTCVNKGHMTLEVGDVLVSGDEKFTVERICMK